MGYHARPNKAGKYKQGYYQPIYENKYIANTQQIVYRSSLEYKFCIYADKSDKVVRWGSEVVSIPYKNIEYDEYGNQKLVDRTYHVDFYMEVKSILDPNLIERWVIEVKPHDEFQRIENGTPPERPEKITDKSLKNWEYSLKEYIKNTQKWKYAKEWCRQRGMFFYVFTEKTINKLFK
jgi:hypothetical protein